MPIKTGKPPRLHPQAITAGKDLKQKKDNMDTVQLDMIAEDQNNRPWLLSAIGEYYPKETKDLLKLCRKVCDRIAKEVA